MQKIKTYDKHGQYIDSFSLPDGIKKEAIIRALNGRGRYIRSQFNKNMKLTHRYEEVIFPINKGKTAIQNAAAKVAATLFTPGAKTNETN